MPSRSEIRALLATWRARLERRRRVREVRLAIPRAAATYVIAVPSDPDAVLDEVAESFRSAVVVAVAERAGTRTGARAGRAAAEPHMPYWARPWPSGIALAEVVFERSARVRGRRVLELGCGLGITATAACEVGAELVVTDCFSEALAFCRYNALRNTGRAPRTFLADWREDRVRSRVVEAGPFDLVLAADVLYEAEDIAPLLRLVPELVAEGGEFWLAEPGRTTSGHFVEAASAAGWAAEQAAFERIWPADAGRARVAVHFFRPVLRS
ncbi:MAG: methyltransferase domain-containing protein [Chloroflexi bacterium]|nr:methyltransferase domain-containing protein [Chloroflexota bacterium]